MWTINKRTLIRYQLPGTGLQEPHSTIRLPEGYSVRGAAEARGIIAILAWRGDKTAVLVVGDAAQFPRDQDSGTEIVLRREEEGPKLPFPICVSISADGRQVAVGFGERAVLVTLGGSDQETRCVWFPVRTPEEMEHVKVGFQACSFSPDGGTLVISTHVKRKRLGDDRGGLEDRVCTSIWPTDGDPAELSSRRALASSQIPCVRFPRE